MRPLALPTPLSLLASLSFAACASPTGVDPVTISLRTPAFATAEEAAAWRGLPRIEGGSAVRVRGMALVGCGDARARAVRRRDVVGIEITAAGADRICPANVSAWIAFEATVSGLTPATYRVRVAVAGDDGDTEATVAVGSP